MKRAILIFAILSSMRAWCWEIDLGRLVQAAIGLNEAQIVQALQSRIREHQALIVISELETWADPSEKQLYSYIQRTGVPLAKSMLSDWYGQIVAIEHGAATEQNVLNTIASLAAQEQIKTIDVFVFLHGSPGELWFVDGGVKTSELSERIRALGTQGKLRIAYNTACFGQSHIQDFLNAGFKVASGARAVNANGATEYPIFLQTMALGLPFGLAIANGNLPGVNAAADELARQFVKSEPVESNKSIGGDSSLSYLHSKIPD